jgi:hypothetical protein
MAEEKSEDKQERKERPRKRTENMEEVLNAWEPKTKLGQDVKQKD